jgi:hypothetical protein
MGHSRGRDVGGGAKTCVKQGDEKKSLMLLVAGLVRGVRLSELNRERPASNNDLACSCCFGRLSRLTGHRRWSHQTQITSIIFTSKNYFKPPLPGSSRILVAFFFPFTDSFVGLEHRLAVYHHRPMRR